MSEEYEPELTNYEIEQWREAAQDTNNPRQAGLLRTKRNGGKRASGYAQGVLGEGRADRPSRAVVNAPSADFVRRNSQRTSPEPHSPLSSAHRIRPLYEGNTGHEDDEPASVKR
jgi:hypothetical protein